MGCLRQAGTQVGRGRLTEGAESGNCPWQWPLVQYQGLALICFAGV